MLGLIVCSVIVVACDVVLSRYGRPKNDIYETVMKALGALFGVATVYMVIVPMVLMTLTYTQCYSHYGRVALISPPNTQGARSEPIVITDRLNGQKYYAFYYRSPDGGIKLDEINADYVTVREDQAAGGYIDSVGVSTLYNPLIWYFVPGSKSDRAQASERTFVRYSMHVPPGTIGTID